MCTPIRASLLTRRLVRTRVIGVSNNLEVMHSREVTIAEVFKENAFTTGLFGKWHNETHYPNSFIGKGLINF